MMSWPAMPTYYCHQCERSVNLKDGDFICAICGSEFVEEMDVESHLNLPQAFASLIGPLPGRDDRHGTHNQAGTSTDSPFFGGFRISTGGQPGHRSSSESHASNRSGESGSEPSPDTVITAFLNELLSNLSAQGAHIQLQISRDPNSRVNIVHRPMSDYVFGDVGLDEVVTQLLNQFEGGSTPVDPKLLPNLPMKPIDERLIEDNEKCPTCMELFTKGETVAELDCHHYFHGECIIPWFRRHNTCPVCRQVVDPTKWLSNDPLEELD